MTYIRTTPAAEAEGELLAFYREQQGDQGYLPGYARVFGHRPAVMAAWAALQRELRRHLDARAYALVSLAAALAGGSSYCALAYARRLLDQHRMPVSDELTAPRGRYGHAVLVVLDLCRHSDYHGSPFRW